MPWEKQFDRNEVVKKAGETFWSCGYEGTSMANLLEEMGIQKGSFYSTFESKRDVLLESLAAYVDERFTMLDTLATAPKPRKALEKHLRAVARDASGPTGGCGCYVVNMALELSQKDEGVQKIVRAALQRHEQLYRTVLEAAKLNGEVSSELDAKSAAKALLAMVLGIRVLARSSADSSTIMAVCEQAIQLINTGSNVDP
jgi:TetR/AcrR family transcriptional regulator, transcriptional repressor for nem operon